jgi:hypothetical protein
MPKLTKRIVDALQHDPDRDVFAWDTELRGFGVRVKPSDTTTFLIQYRNGERRTRRFVIGQYGPLTVETARDMAQKKLAGIIDGGDPSPDWSVTAAREETKRLKREIDQGRDPMAERDEARESPNMRQLIDRYLEEHATKLVEPSWGPRKTAEIQPEDVDRLLDQIASGTPGKKGRKPTPVRANRVGEILRKMFNLAIRWRICTDNPLRVRPKCRSAPGSLSLNR